ncbi:hypothetical protein [Pseudomonas sp. WS 5059]|uniref:ParA family protein n=1 Tax=unclassified Pseudomonas TaxID=196821 RepID=UPI0015B45205|nr:hypothetical protein [Pseudomonas sp. WS 5059]
MKIAAVLSTKGGPRKTTVTASLGAFCADSSLHTHLIDLDNRPSSSSFIRSRMRPVSMFNPWLLKTIMPIHNLSAARPPQKNTHHGNDTYFPRNACIPEPLA